MSKYAFGAAVALASAAMTIAPVQASVVNLYGSDSSGSTGNVRAYSVVDGSETINIQASAWSVDSGGTIRSAALGRWGGGLGVINGSSDDSHTVDSSGRVDFVIFQFDQLVELNRVYFTEYGDTDAIIRYGTVGGPWNANPGLNLAPFASLTGLTPNSILAPGTDDSGWRDVNASNATANWWVISASSIIDQVWECSGNWWRKKCDYEPEYDFFKIKKLDISYTAVPEPSTWTMMILGFGAIGWSMRRKSKSTLTGKALAA